MNSSRSQSYILPSSIYFIYYAALAALVPFLALYYQELGLPGAQIGILLGISPLVSLLANPLWSGLADATHRHKAILTVTLLATVVIMAVLPSFTTLWPLFLAISIYSFFVAPVISLVDSATMTMLGDQKEKYGRLRVWGSVGWGLGVLFVGGFLQRYGLKWSFWIFGGGMLLVLFPARRLTFDHVQSGSSFRQGMRKFLVNRRWIFFLAMTFIAGIGLSVYNNYLSVLMQSLGGSKSLTGIAITVATLSELPVMFFSGSLLRRLKTRGLFILAMAVTGIRCLLLGVAGSPAGVMAVQVLHGMTFAALLVSGVTYAAENAPPGLGATAQGLFSSVLMGFGAAAGNLLGGILIERLNPTKMYGVIGGIVLVGLVVFLLLEKWLMSVRLRRETAAEP